MSSLHCQLHPSLTRSEPTSTRSYFSLNVFTLIIYVCLLVNSLPVFFSSSLHWETKFIIQSFTSRRLITRVLYVFWDSFKWAIKYVSVARYLCNHDYTHNFVSKHLWKTIFTLCNTVAKSIAASTLAIFITAVLFLNVNSWPSVYPRSH